jgi:hypothetical protein
LYLVSVLSVSCSLGRSFDRPPSTPLSVYTLIHARTHWRTHDSSQAEPERGVCNVEAADEQ